MKWLFSSVLGVVGLFLILFGCLFAGAGGGAYYFTIYTLRDWVEVPGIVTTFESRTSNNSDGIPTTRWCPWVEYTTTSGEAFEVFINECSSPRAYDAGDTVTVLYNPAAPDQAQLQGGVREIMGNIFGIGFAIIGCLPLALGILLCAVAVGNAARRSRPGFAPAGAA